VKLYSLVVKKFFFPVVLIILFILALPTIFSRIRTEYDNVNVEICLDKEKFASLCESYGYPLEEFLIGAKNYGVSSFYLKEDDKQSLINKGKMIVFSSQERKKLLALGLSFLPYYIRGEEFWILTDKILASRIKFWLAKYDISVQIYNLAQYIIFSLPSPNINIPLGHDIEEIKLLNKFGFRCVLEVKNCPQRETIENYNNLYLFTQDALLTSEEIQELSKYSMPIALDEFGPKINRVSQFYKHFPIVRMHTIAEKEYRLLHSAEVSSIERIVGRILRAVRERNIRVIYLTPVPPEVFYYKNPVHTQFKFLELLKAEITKHKFKLSNAKPFVITEIKFLSLRKLLAFVIATLFPLISLYYILKLETRSSEHCFILTCLISLFGGVLASALLSHPIFYSKLESYTGVKLSFLLPIFLAGCFLYKKDMNKITAAPLTIRTFVMILIVGLIFLMLVIRSGHTTLFNFTFREEVVLREFAEKMFSVRPRTKEFLFGHPLLLIGLFLKNRGSKLWRLCVFLGLIGQVSVINTFLHLHTPFAISLFRSCLGVVLGYFVGKILLLFYHIWIKRWT